METDPNMDSEVPHSDRSDPTYEAWKLFSTEESAKTVYRSDPTYEAWKHEALEEWLEKRPQLRSYL